MGIMEGGKTYSWITGSVYLFNILIGSGLLTLPKPFADVGWVLGLVVYIIVSVMSYVSATFILECLAIYNAITKHSTRPTATEETNFNIIENKAAFAMEKINEDNTKDIRSSTEANMSGEKISQLDPTIFEVSIKAEWTDLCLMFFNKFGVFLYYIVISIQLYGIISLFFAMVSKSLTSIVCGSVNWNILNKTLICSRFTNFTVMEMYYINIAAFVCIMCPFIYFDITATKMIQFITFIYHILALVVMIILPLKKIVQSKQTVSTKLVDFSSLSNYFGAVLFLMACHPGIPAILTPISDKTKINRSLFLPFFVGVIVVVIFIMSAIYAFEINEIQDLYTLNFSHPIFFKYFLEFFPVVSLASTLPVTAIVLRENLKKLLLRKPEMEYNVFTRRFVFPTLTITPPIIIAYCTTDITMIISYTGTFFGGALVYLIPVLLVHFARKKALISFGRYSNPHGSVFRHQIWLYMICIWYICSTGIVIYYKTKSLY